MLVIIIDMFRIKREWKIVMNIYRRALMCTFCRLLSLNACDDHNSSSGEIQNSQNESLNSQAMIKAALEALPVTQNAFPKSQNDESFGMYANTFAFRFVQSIKTEHRFVYSPFSLHTILTALYDQNHSVLWPVLRGLTIMVDH